MKRKYFIQTFGCLMNYSDSERMAAFLTDAGFEESLEISKADLIVLNTCSIRQKAEDRINGIIKNIRSNLNSSAKIILTGCIARRVWDEQKAVNGSTQKNYNDRATELAVSFSGIDLVIETKDFPNIGPRLSKLFNDPLINPTNRKENLDHYLSFKPQYKSNFKGFVPISTGCNHFCTYCIVPFSRGKEVCRNGTEIIREVFDLVTKGYSDITLLGQTVNRWINHKFINEYKYNEALTFIEGLNTKPLGEESLRIWRDFFTQKANKVSSVEKNFENNLTEPKDFLQLLQVLNEIPGEWWLTFVSSHPNYMTADLISWIGRHTVEDSGNHMRAYMHFALQSGSDRILKKMNRRHSMQEFINKVMLMKKEIPNVSLSTDIIVGFLGEDEDDFKQTLLAQNTCRFDMIYISEYSPRKGTAASRLIDTIPENIKSKRKEELNNCLKAIAHDNNQMFLNKVIRVLLESKDRKTGFLIGRNNQNKEVRVKSLTEESLIGKFINVKITSTGPWSLEGEKVTSSFSCEF